MEFGPPVRARYPDAGRCGCVCDGRPCAPEQVAVRTMNFGQHWVAFSGTGRRSGIPVRCPDD